jgi:hypothetical protein
MHIQFYPFNKMAWFIIAMVCLFAQRSSAQQAYANSQTNGVTGICLLCGVTSPNNPVNRSSLDDYSLFNITAGLGTVTVHQTLIFPSLSSSDCDSLIIGIGAPTNPPVNPYGPVTVQTLNGGSLNGDVRVVEDAILRQVQGYGRAEIVLKPQRAFDRVKLTLNISGLGLATSFRVYYAYRKPGLPAPLVTDSARICRGAGTVLNADPGTSGEVRWYDAPSGGNLLFTGNAFSVQPDSTRTYYASASNGNCTSARVPATVVVSKLPAPQVNAPQAAICGSQLLSINNHQPGLNYAVEVSYTGAGGVPVLDTSYVVSNSAQFETPPSSSAGDVQASIAIQALNADGSCQSDKTELHFTVGGAGQLPIVDADQVNACEGSSVTLHAYTADPGVPFIHWYDAPEGGNLLYTGDYYTVSATNVTYYVTSQAQCEYPVRKAVRIITSPRPPMPTLTTADTVYMPRFSGITLTANGVPGSTIHWYRSDTAGIPVFTGNSYSFTALSNGTLFYYAGAELNGCESERRRIMVVVYSGNPPGTTSETMITNNDTRARVEETAPRSSVIQALQLYPNPSSGEIRFKASKDLSGSLAIIRDVNGREVQREILQRNGMNISRLPVDGIYFIQVISGKQEVFTGKILLQR